ncbi:hypothetical protein B0H14DRAFT_3126221 [Mycena olivaceomarginata]|nr:hypothetical protein B0H14DRAFT_3126221 [Mycena olivaceomarginata]
MSTTKVRVERQEGEGDGKWKECEGERPNDSTMTDADVLRIFSDGIREELEMTQIGRSSRRIGIVADGRETRMCRFFAIAAKKIGERRQRVAYSITGHGTPNGQAPRFFLEGRSPKFDIYRSKHRNGGLNAADRALRALFGEPLESRLYIDSVTVFVAAKKNYKKCSKKGKEKESQKEKERFQASFTD